LGPTRIPIWQILKIELDKLPVIVLGNSDGAQVGDQVLAIGNPFGVGQTVTSGIVSALGRNQLGINTFENFIQTDAAINPGNSGGALVDTNGNLLGINTAIYSRSGGNMGIGFAIPVSTAKQVLEGIVRDGRITRGWIGVEPNDLSAELAQTFDVKTRQGVIITGVLQNGPAAASRDSPRRCHRKNCRPAGYGRCSIAIPGCGTDPWQARTLFTGAQKSASGDQRDAGHAPPPKSPSELKILRRHWPRHRLALLGCV
jgi:hypothetical protein